jgi:hypothetical protein
VALGRVRRPERNFKPRSIRKSCIWKLS